MYDLKVVVEEVKGFCDMPMHVGDYFEVQGGRIIIPEGKYMCLWALQTMMPFLPVKQRKIDEENDWIPYTERLCCPDPNGMVIYRIETIDPLTKKVIKKERPETDTVKKRMLVNEELCSGCRACETVCSFTHTGSFCGENAKIQIKKIEEEGKDVPLVCRQCGNAPCIEACPVDALYKGSQTKAVLINEEKCISCKKCEKACPFGSIHFSETNKPIICDLCGGDPACVKRCPVSAITFGNAGKKN